MSRTATVYQIFVSSPRDVRSELQIVQNAISEWNQLHGSDAGVVFEVVSGYTSVAPAFAEAPQDVVTNVIGDDYDIYVGIMWHTFGTPTKAAPSGTVEEFERALTRFKNDDNVYIGFFFKVTPPTDLREMDGNELAKVQDFKKRVGAEGGFYSDYVNDDELRLSVARLIKQFLKKKSGLILAGDEKKTISSRASGPAGALPAMRGEDLGWIDVQEELTAVAWRLTEHFNWITAQSTDTTSVIDGASHELEALQGRGDATLVEVKPVISRVSEAMIGAAAALRGRMPKLREDLEMLPNVTQAFVDVANDFEKEPQDWQDFLEAVGYSIEMLRANEESMAGMLNAIRGLPRMTSDFNRSRRDFVDVHEQLMNEVRSAHIRLAAALEQAQEAQKRRVA